MKKSLKAPRLIVLSIGIMLMLSGGVGAKPQYQREPQPRQQWANGLPGLTHDYKARMQTKLASGSPTGPVYQHTSSRPTNYVPQTQPKIPRNGKSAVEILGAPRATFTVDYFFDDIDTADLNPGDGICADTFNSCGLRTAIMEANALPGLDTIIIPAGEIAFNYAGSDEDLSVTGDLDITDDVVIQGAGALTTTINAAGLGDRVFHIFNGAIVDIYDLAIINGGTLGGGLLGGAIFVHCSADVLLNRLNIGVNSAAYGGAIFVGACVDQTSYLYAYNTTLYANSAVNLGGGIDVFLSAEVYLTNVTIGLNLSGLWAGGLIADGSEVLVVIDQSTIAGNSTEVGGTGGGGIRIVSGADVTISDSIIAYNEMDGGGNDCFGDYTSAGDNIYTVADGCIVTSDDIVNPTESLGGLSAVGPGEVGVMPIDTTSSAWEKDGDFATCPLTDARNILRPEEFNCDSGAFEVETSNDYPYPFALIDPENGSGIADANTLSEFTWGTSLTATDYDLEIYRTSDEPDALIVDSNLTAAADGDLLTCDSTTCTLTVDTALRDLLTDGSYQWWVTANNAADLSREAFNNPFVFNVNPANQLIDNGGFENLGGDDKPDITPWVVKNASGDKAKCNKDKDGDGIPDKIVANTGNCAFQFKNVVGEVGKLEQILSLGTILPTVGDMLTLNVATKTTGGATGKVKVVVKYGDDTKTKISVDLDNPDTYALETGSGTLTNTTITKFKIGIKSSSTSGKLYVDDVSLTYTSSDVLIPLPQANLRSRR